MQRGRFFKQAVRGTTTCCLETGDVGSLQNILLESVQ